MLGTKQKPRTFCQNQPQGGSFPKGRAKAQRHFKIQIESLVDSLMAPPSSPPHKTFRGLKL